MRHSLSWIRRSLRNHTTAARRRAAAPEGLEGRSGFRVRVFCKGLAEMLDLKKAFAGEREEESENWERDEI